MGCAATEGGKAPEMFQAAEILELRCLSFLESWRAAVMKSRSASLRFSGPRNPITTSAGIKKPQPQEQGAFGVLGFVNAAQVPGCRSVHSLALEPAVPGSSFELLELGLSQGARI